MNPAGPLTILSPPAVLSSSPFGSISLSQIILLFLAVCGLTLVMLSTRRRLRESKALGGGSVRKRYAEFDESRAARKDLDQVMMELDQLSREIHGRLDTKLARLEAVLRDADGRIEVLSRLVGEARRVTGGSPVEPVPDDPPSGHSDAGDDARYGSVYRLADQGISAVDIAREMGKRAGEVELILSLRRARKQARSDSLV